MAPGSDLRLTTIESHTCGHPTRVVVDGLPAFNGTSVAEQRACARHEHDDLRTFLCREPRGHGAMYAAYVVPSRVADAGVVFCSQVGYDDMCGHGTIGVVTALCESGRLPRGRAVRLETPAGVVTAEPHWEGRRVATVSFDSVPAFLFERDVAVDVPGVGQVRGDVAFGGNWYLYVDAASIGQAVTAANLPELLRVGSAIKEARNGVAEVEHPLHAHIARSLIGVSYCGPPLRDPAADQCNVCGGERDLLRPLAVRHRHLRPDGGAARTRRTNGRRGVSQRGNRRRRVPRPHQRGKPASGRSPRFSRG